MYTFTVLGVAAPKGSSRAFMRPGMKFPVVTHDSAATKPWQFAVQEAARTAVGDAPPLVGPVLVRLAFYLPRPKSAPKRVQLPTTRPDLDKLVRNVLDGLKTGGIYGDDGQVVAVVAQKRYAAGVGIEGLPRCGVHVVLLDVSRVTEIDL